MRARIACILISLLFYFPREGSADSLFQVHALRYSPSYQKDREGIYTNVPGVGRSWIHQLQADVSSQENIQSSKVFARMYFYDKDR